MTEKPDQTTLENIARKHLFVKTLETRNSDEADFHDVAVWNIKSALEAAFLAGAEAAGRNQ
jgi:uncharacterized membrane protein